MYNICLQLLIHYTLAISTALGVSPFAIRLLPISCAENCFLHGQLMATPTKLSDSPRERRRELDRVNRVREVLARDKLGDLAERRV